LRSGIYSVPLRKKTVLRTPESDTSSAFPTMAKLFALIWSHGGGRPNLDAYRDMLTGKPSAP
jgi:hypothetical protein